MIALSCIIALVAISIAALLNLYRLAVRPDVLDRALALDTLVINTIALIVVIGIWYGTTTQHLSVWRDQSGGSGIALRTRRAIRRSPLVK
jgi:hypothetical protein